MGASERNPEHVPNPRYDPDRREKIIAACLDVIAARGVDGTSARRVAAQAGVPLGSITYHFDSMEALLHQSFRRFTDIVADRFERRMKAAADSREARAAIEAIINEDVLGNDRDLVLTTELYAVAARNAVFRDLTARWMLRSRVALEKHFDPLTVRVLDATIEGLTLHRALDVEPQPREMVAAALDRVLGS
ncbi:TetR family transcriptional regulator [Rarobacter faecitabidus]|uniref:TetR family transcriptional regulator n=1 Tax=Rarobacter faecitabidus TaxID=13243 RepID=A0A542ZVG6_RARFA|nr:TetR family transcriptional regulator [Rarobacter faecitabidus]TQL64246.1 TetR family transcriptional regulator [Rarobacter faecitabidus]